MNRTIKRAVVVGACLTLSTMSWQTAAGAAPATTCTGTITGGTFGSIVVPEGRTCTLQDVTVAGKVTARRDARLFVSSSDIKHVHGLKAEMVQVRGSEISSHVHIQQGDTNDPGTDIRVQDSSVGGNIHIHHNVGTIEVDGNVVGGHILIQHNRSHLIITDNTVAKNLQVMKTTSADAKDVTGNAVSGQIHCRDNATPFIGGPNVSAMKVHGNCFVA